MEIHFLNHIDIFILKYFLNSLFTYLMTIDPLELMLRMDTKTMKTSLT